MTVNADLNLTAVRAEMEAAAGKAAQEYLDEHLGGEDRYACGFAWVDLIPDHKGNTRAGKAERKVFEALGFRKDWTGKVWAYWNPSKLGVQNIDTKEAGARAAAEVLKAYGFTAHANSRLD